MTASLGGARWWLFRLSVQVRNLNGARAEYLVEWSDTDRDSPRKRAQQIGTQGIFVPLYTDPTMAPVGFMYYPPHLVQLVSTEGRPVEIPHARMDVVYPK